jgi:hypothetical protein
MTIVGLALVWLILTKVGSNVGVLNEKNVGTANGTGIIITVGSVVGSAVTIVGSNVEKLGAANGTGIVITLGSIVGSAVGWLLVTTVDSLVTVVGLLSIGISQVGIIVKLFVGFAVGNMVGIEVGGEDGLKVGITVGKIVGCEVGISVG